MSSQSIIEPSQICKGNIVRQHHSLLGGVFVPSDALGFMATLSTARVALDTYASATAVDFVVALFQAFG